MANRKQRGWLVPGFGLPLRWPEMQSVRWQPIFQPDENTLLLSVLDASENSKFCYTVRERTILALINILTDMPDWDRKIFEADSTARWKSELLMTGKDVTRSMADWCVEEVKYYVYDFINSGIVPALDGGIVKSDVRVPLFLHSELQKALASLRKDAYQQSSNDDILVDLVDPYLYPFAFGTSRTLRRDELLLSDCILRCGEGETVKLPSKEDCAQKDPAKYPNDIAWSRHFQWLPFDVTFDKRGEGGSRYVFTQSDEKSYINNVHPEKHHYFYSVLEKLIDTIVPMFNRTLVELKAPGHGNQRLHVAVLGRQPMIVREPGDFRPPEQRSTSQWLNSQNRFKDWLFVDLKKEFWNIGLQMILQVTEIDLSPEKSHYNGEEWHVQGQMNERICATAIYVYSSQNISTPVISFRRRINAEEAMLAKGYIQEPPWAPEIYGAQDGDPVIQNIGDVALHENRLVTFPNIFQMQRRPFELVDTTKSGHLKLLKLYLIDPNRRIMSTAMVPVQRRDWWAEEVRRRCTRFWRLPLEVYEKIVDMVDEYPISREVGDKMRREFESERKEFQKKHTKAMMDYLSWDLDWDSE